jgi:hypothetical protein
VKLAMSSTDVPASPEKQPDGARRRRPSRLAANTGYSAPSLSIVLLSSSVISIVLVILIGVLTAIMQYQSRLLHFQPGITAGQLVYYVRVENAINDILERLANTSRSITESSAKAAAIQNEVDFRIWRICELFEKDVYSYANVTTCSNFLRRSPFEASHLGIKFVNTPPQSAASMSSDGTPSVDTINDRVLQTIKTKFVEIMGNPQFDNTTFSTLVELYQPDLASIAQRNQEFWLEIYPKYQQETEQFQSSCAYARSLAAHLRYRTVELGPCNQDFFSLAPLRSYWPTNTRLTERSAQTQTKETLETKSPIKPASIEKAGDAAAKNGLPDNLEDKEEVAPEPRRDDPKFIAGAPVQPLINGGIGDRSAQALALDQQRDFELVTHYMFYEKLAFGYLHDILISPSDFLTFLLVCFGGILGAVLRIVFSAYVSGRDASMRNLIIGPILGLICALVVYILFRAGFIAMTDRVQSDDSTGISPFLLTIMSMASGLLSERAVDLLRQSSDKWLGSVESTQTARWAVHLRSEMKAHDTTEDQLSSRLEISSDKLREWMDERTPVPIDLQRKMSLVLGVPLRSLFSDISPRQSR